MTRMIRFSARVLAAVLWLFGYAIPVVAVVTDVVKPGVAFTYETFPVNDGATLTGKVTFRGQAPPPMVFEIVKNPEVCRRHPHSTPEGKRKLFEVRVRGSALQDVVVYMEGIEKGKPFHFDGANFKAKDCEFTPYVNVGVKRAPLRVENLDEAPHNTHTYELVGDWRLILMNLLLPEKGSKIDVPLPVRKGNVVKLECDQHDYMHNWIKVVDNPYYAMVVDDGGFTIDEIPPGNYRVAAWHPVLGVQEKEVTFTAGGKNTLNFEFSGKKRL